MLKWRTYQIGITLGLFFCLSMVPLEGISQILTEPSFLSEARTFVESLSSPNDLDIEQPVTRSDLALVLVPLMEIDRRRPMLAVAPRFKDVPTDHRAYSAIQVMVKNGVMSGYRRGRFYPDQVVTRGEGFAIFSQADGVYPFEDDHVDRLLSQFPDEEDVPTWARAALASALYSQFVNLESAICEESKDRCSLLQPQESMTWQDVIFAISQYYARERRLPLVPAS